MSFTIDPDDCRAADAAGWLTPAQQALIHEQDWLRMLAPRACGGAELALPEAVRLEEAIALQDGSMGWVVTLCAGAGWFAGFLAPGLARAILATPDVCLAGSGAPMATHFTLNAVLRERGTVLADDAGKPRIRAFVVPASHVTVESTWGSIGLRASASHAYRIDGAWVPAVHGFTIDPAAATAPGPR
jgi:alkylation response protein AidB-like acyl-CoA dehydrogenase